MNTTLIWDNLVAYSLQIGLLVGLAAFVPAVLRLRLPGARLVYWHVLLAACLLLPLVRPWKQEVITTSVQVTAPVAMAVPVTPAPRRGIPRSEIALVLLAAGAVARLGWLGVGLWRLRQYRRHARPLEPANAWSVEADLRISSETSSPVTFGVRKPVVLLPARFPELGARTQQAILCHEVLHVRRHDWLFTVGEELVRAVFWFHPAIWWLLGEIGLAREQAVDREAVEMTKSRDEYVDALLAIAGARPQLDLAPAPLFLRKRHFKQRVVSILKEVRMSRTRLISALAAGLGTLAAACWFVTGTFPLAAAPQMVADAPGVTVEMNGAAVMHRTSVAYPDAARKQGVQGVVTVEVKLDAGGNVADARVLSGPEELRKTALQSVLQWHYTRDAANSTRQVNITFQPPPARESRPVTGIVGGIAGSSVIGGIIGSVPAAQAGLEPARRRSLEGSTLKQINVVGLPDQQRDELLARLPVHVGDTLSNQSMSAVTKEVRQFDEHLNSALTTNSTGEATLLIMAPGASPPVASQTAPPPPSGDTKRITIGGSVQQSKLISQPKPVYPPLAKQAKISGVVQLQAIISKDGTMQNLTVISGHPLLIPAALEAVKQWVYQKTLLNGEPVEVITQIDVNFTLAEQ
jgi:TonB family protein